MSGKSPSHEEIGEEAQPRRLTDAELELLAGLSRIRVSEALTKILSSPDTYKVKNLTADVLGSVRFMSHHAGIQKFGTIASEGQFLDDDGELVFVSFLLDEFGEPFEVDIWKADYSRLRRLPTRFEMSSQKPHLPGATEDDVRFFRKLRGDDAAR